MIKSFKRKIANTHEKRRLFSNIFSLGFLQVANYIFPLITAPYLVRVLGPEYYGLLAFSGATIAYFGMLTNYGFNWTAVPQVSIHRNDQQKLNEIFSAVITVKLLLLIVSLLLLTILVLYFAKFNQYWILYFITFLGVAANVFVPTWLYQGLETMKYITYQSIFTKLFFTIAVFIFVHKQEDYIYVPVLTVLGTICSAIWSQHFIRTRFNIKFSWPSFEKIRDQLVDGWHVFYSSMATSLYTVSATFVLGLFASNTVVGYYAAADKVVQAAKGLYGPISQAIYPMIAKRFNENMANASALIKRITLLTGSFNLFISFLLFIFSADIIKILFGAEYQQSVLLLKIMSFLPFVIGLSNVLGVQVMLNINLKKQVGLIISTCAAIGLLLNFIFVPVYHATATASIVTVVEVSVTLLFSWYILKKTDFKLRS